MSGWYALGAGLLGAAAAFAVMAVVTWADKPKPTQRRLGSLTSVDEGRQG